MTDVSEDIEIIKDMIRKNGEHSQEVAIKKPSREKKVLKKKAKVKELSEQTSLLKTKHAKIVNASIHKIVDLWKRHKPQGLGFADTDAIIVTAKTNDGKILRETFYTCIKPDGTFNMKSLSHASEARRRMLANFLIYNKITDSIENYNILDRIGEWKGKSIEIISSEDRSLKIKMF